MITYELALKLKEAGFPQSGKDGDWYFDSNENPFFCIAYNWDKRHIKIPTLFELIEACGQYTIRFCLEQHSNDWRAGVYQGNIQWVSGKSPEEAVANLWINLNKK